MEARQLEFMIQDEQSGSVIIVGGPGTGKTHLVTECTRHMTGNVLTIDGLLCADFTANLHLLLHHFNICVDQEGEMMTFEEISESLIHLHKKSHLPYTVIVIDSLDRFVVSGEHQHGSGQQLLYGLLELAAVLPVLVVGVTRRVDCVEGMEKRVRSRFSQNVIYMDGQVDHRLLILQKESLPHSISSLQADLSVPELLVLLSVIRLLHVQKGKLTISGIIHEYTTTLRHETDSSLMISSSSASKLGERQVLKAIESLIHRGLLQYARNDHWQHRHYRLLSLAVPSFTLPEYILTAPNCPVPLRALTMSICAGQ